jgi:hypothetical protein
MTKKMLTLSVALLLSLTIAGAAVAATPTGNGHGFGQTVGSLVVRVADFLGIDVSEVKDLRNEGQTMAQILGDENVAKFVALSIAQRQSFLGQLVEEGKITLEQAAACEAEMEAKIMDRLTSTEFGLGQGVQQAKRVGHRRGR